MKELLKFILDYLQTPEGSAMVTGGVLALIAWIKRKLDLEKMGQRMHDNGMQDQKLIEKIVGRKVKIKIRK